MTVLKREKLTMAYGAEVVRIIIKKKHTLNLETEKIKTLSMPWEMWEKGCKSGSLKMIQLVGHLDGKVD